jgi:hypothetical protein
MLKEEKHRLFPAFSAYRIVLVGNASARDHIHAGGPDRHGAIVAGSRDRAFEIKRDVSEVNHHFSGAVGGIAVLY